jgi:hypothetical protein
MTSEAGLLRSLANPSSGCSDTRSHPGRLTGAPIRTRWWVFGHRVQDRVDEIAHSVAALVGVGSGEVQFLASKCEGDVSGPASHLA